MRKQDVMSTLLKRAMGYTAEEIVEEFAGDERGGELIKRKVTTKPVPPDVTALKAYIELTREDDEFRMSDEELSAEKARLLQELAGKRSGAAGRRKRVT